MRKIPVSVHEAFVSGLRSKNLPMNQDRLSRSYNAIPTRTGLQGWSMIPQVVSQAQVSFPFPQMFFGRVETLIVREASVSRLDLTGSGEESLVVTLDYIDRVTATAIQVGGIWQYVDLGSVFMLTNGTSVVFTDNLDFSIRTPVAYVAPNMAMNALCSWRGRVFSGGFRTGEAWQADWRSHFLGLEGSLYSGLGYELKENMVLWSTVGAADFSFRWLLYPDEALVAAAGTDETGLSLALARGDLGFLQMPFRGAVLAIVPFGEGVVVYGENGIVMLEHVSQLTTFRMNDPLLSNEIGIAGRGAVAGNTAVHCFVTTRGELGILLGKQLHILGFSEFFQPMLAEDILISFKDDEYQPMFFIASQSRCYVLVLDKGEEGYKLRGLGECGQLITSVASLGGETVCVAKNFADKSLRVEVGKYDLGIRAQKSVQTARVAFSGSQGMQIAVKASYGGERVVTSRFRQLNNEGNATVKTSALEFQMCLQASPSDGISIQQMDLEVETEDKRFIRSAYDRQTQQ